MKAKELITKVLVGNPKTIVSIFAMMFLICSIQGIGYAADPVFTEDDDDNDIAGHQAVREVPENTAAGVDIGNAVEATDADPGDTDTLVYSLGGTDSGSFSIVSTSGQLQTKAMLDHETKDEYTVTVTVTDGTTPVTSTVTINVNNINEAPVFPDSVETDFSIEEGATANRLIDTVGEAVDPEDGTVTYGLSEIADHDVFKFNPGNRQLSTKDISLDFEGKKTYTVEITATDDGLGEQTEETSTIEITITVTNVNEPPVFATGADVPVVFADGVELDFEIAENTPAGEPLVGDSDNNNPFTVTDPDDEDTVTITLGGADGSFFAYDYDSEEDTVTLETSAALDFEVRGEYTVEVIATDGEGLEDKIVITITVENENEPPVFDPDTITFEDIPENTEIGEFIGLVPEATDPDDNLGANPYNKTLDVGAFFSLNSDRELTLSRALSHETQTDHLVQVTVTDEGSPALEAIINVIIKVTDIEDEEPANRKPSFDAGPFITIPIAENTGAGVIGALTATDLDDDTLTYMLVDQGISGDAEHFSIVSTSGQLRIEADPDDPNYPNYEETAPDHSYTLMVTVRDNKAINNQGNVISDTTVDDTITVTITVTDVNEAPEFVAENIGAATFSIAENEDPDTAVTSDPANLTFAVVDPETLEGSTVSYSLDRRSDAFFDIDEDGVLTSAVTLDHETQEAYTVGITATDDGTTADGKTTPESATITVIIEVTDVNEAPVLDETAVRSIVENTVGTVDIGALIMVTDPEGGTLEYTSSLTEIVGVEPIEGTGVQLITISNADYDHEIRDAYTVEITATDDGTIGDGTTENVLEKFAKITVTITVTDVNEAPEFPAATDTRSVAENISTNTAIYIVPEATDEDRDATDNPQSLTYALVNDGVSGTDANSFTFDPTTRELKVKEELDYETTQSYTVRFTVTDDGMIDGGARERKDDTITVTITVTDVDEPDEIANKKPSFDDGFSTTRLIEENAIAGTNIGGDGSGTDVDDPVKATDPDNTDTLVYMLGGTDVSSFRIDSATGQLTTSAPLDHETKEEYEVTVSVTDGKDDHGGTDIGVVVDDTITVTITVTDVNEVPVFREGSPTNRFIAEGSYPEGHLIDNWVVAMDEDEPTQTLTYSITSTDDAFDIDPESGELKTKGTLTPNHEQHEDGYSYRVTVTVMDDGIIDGVLDEDNKKTAAIEVIINVTDVNEKPVFDPDTSTTRSIDENEGADVVIGDPVVATDPEGDTVDYILEGTVDAGSFSIELNNETGDWELKTSASAELDYETKEKYIVTVRATDMGGVVGAHPIFSTIEITINVNNLNEKPMFVSDTTFDIEENAVGISIAVEAEDPDINTPGYNTLTYALVSITPSDPMGGNAYYPFRFEEDSTSGELNLADDADLNHEDQNDYELVFEVRDSVDPVGSPAVNEAADDTIMVTIRVLDVPGNEPVNKQPFFSEGPSAIRSIGENTDENTDADVPMERNIGDLVKATDDDGDELTYDLGDFSNPDGSTSNPGFDIVAETGQLITMTNAIFDYEVERDNDRGQIDGDDNTYTVTVTVTDNKVIDNAGEVIEGDAVDDTIEITINVTDVNEPPTFNVLTGAGSGAMPFTIDESEEADTDVDEAIMVASPMDPDTDNSDFNTLKYSFLVERPVADRPVGRDHSFFNIDPSDGQLSIAQKLDHEEDRSGDGAVDGADYDYKVTIGVSDGKDAEGNEDLTADDWIDVVIRVENVNEKPTFNEADPVREVSEAADPSEGPVSFDDAVLAIDPDLVSDGADPPIYPSINNHRPLTYAITDDSGFFGIEENNGVLFLNQRDEKLDHEAENDYKVTVTATDDGELSDEIVVIIKVLDDDTEDDEPSNKKPVFEAPLTERELNENSMAISDPVVATDPEGDKRYYALKDADDSLFTINRETGQLEVKDVLNYEDLPAHATKVAEEKSYMVMVEVRDELDGSGNPAANEAADDTIMVFIEVKDVNDPPVFDEAPTSPTPSLTRQIEERTAANRSIGLPLAVTDEDIPAQMLSYVLDGPDKDSFSYELTAEAFVLKTKEPLDRETKDSYTVTVTVTDDDEDDPKFTTATVTINVLDINEAVANVAPRFDFRGSINISVDENEMSITVPEATDPDPDPDYGELEYVLVDGGDKDLFTFNSGTRELTFKTPPDYEDATNLDHSYTVTVTVTDGRDIDNNLDPSDNKVVDDTITITINVTDVNEAPGFPAATDTRDVDENTAAGMPIGAPVAATDPDDLDGTPDANPETAGAQFLEYSLGGTDVASFEIDGGSGQLQTKAALDYEAKDSYEVTITATDGNTDDNAIITVTITVNDVNEAPEFPATTEIRSVAENTRTGMPIGAPVEATDPDGTDADPETVGNQRLTYTLDDGTDAASFAINSRSGQLITDGALDFEDKVSYEVTITVSDGNTDHDDTITVTISIEDVNEAPEFPESTVDTLIVAENTAAGLAIGAPVVAIDPDGTDADPETDGDQSLMYSLGDTADDDSFDIDRETGQLMTDGALDFEAQDSYEVMVTVSDGNTDHDDTITVAIEVINVNEAPVFTEDTVATRFVPENTPADMPIGAPVEATDPDGMTDANPETAGIQSLIYSLGGTDAASFDIDTETGQLKTMEPLDHGTKPEYMVTVTAFDGEHKTAIDVPIEVTDNEAPVFTEGETATREVAENTDAGMPIGDAVAATDPDDPDGTDADPDTDGDQSLMYSLGDTADDDSFTIDDETGQLQTKDPLNFEDQASYEVMVTVSDGALDTSIPVTIGVANVNEAPMFDSDTAERMVAENTAAEMPIGDPVAATDPDDPDGSIGDADPVTADAQSLTYSLGDTADDGSFAIDPDTGQLMTKDDLDFEAKASYEVTVTVSDGILTAEMVVTVTIGVTDVNEAPVFTEGETATREVAENTGAGEDIGALVAATDPDGMTDANPDTDGDQSLTYSLGDTADDDSFAIDSDTGQLQTKEALDYEDAANPDHSYEVTITVSDGNTDHDDTITVTITVTNVNEAPEFPAETETREVVENTGTGMPIGDPVAATDPDGMTDADPETDGDQSLTYSLGDTADDGSFAIDPDTGQLMTKDDLDFEAKASYEVTVTVSDGILTAEMVVTVTIGVTDVNEAPVFTEGETATREVAENTGAGEDIGALVAATDPDGMTDANPDTVGDQSLTYELGGTDAASFGIDTSGQLQTKAALDYEDAANPDHSYEVTITVSDGNTDHDATITVTITVTNVNEAPEFPAETETREVVENTGTGMPIGDPVAATDPDGMTDADPETDGDQSLIYSLGDTADDGSFAIDPDTGQLMTKDDLDFEAKASYEVTVTVSDGILTAEMVVTVTIGVTDVNEAPVFTEGETATREVAENTGAGEDIGALVAATDPDGMTDANPDTVGDQSLTYELGGTDAASFGIDTSGQLQTKAALDYEDAANPDHSYEVTITVSDGNTDHDATITVTITVTNVNEAPEFPAETETREVVENTGTGMPIGDPVAATDPDGMTDADPETDGDQSLIYSLGDTADDGSFAIDPETGQLMTKDDLDFEAKASYEVTITVSDGNTDHDATITVTITVTNVNEAPEFPAAIATRLVAENTEADEDIGLPVAATDPDGMTDADPETDGIQSLTYSLGDTADDDSFAIDPDTGQLQTKEALDFEDKGSYEVTVTVSDGILTAEMVVTVIIGVTDVNEAPMFTEGETATREVAENTDAGEDIGLPVAATDPDGETDANPETDGIQSLTYSLGGTDAASFDIGTSGQLQTKAALDFEDKASYEVTVTVSDGNTDHDATITVTITVNDVNDAPMFDSETAALSVNENTAADVIIGEALMATDQDAGDAVMYSLGGEDMASFDIEPTTGQLKTLVMLDPETKDPYTVMVIATDTGGLTDSITVTIAVNEAPMFDSETAERSVAENTAADMIIGEALMATDPDEGDEVTYTLGGEDAASFAIDETTGQLMTLAMLDPETKASYTVMVIATDTGGLTDSITVTIAVNEAPMFDSETAERSVDENTAADMIIGEAFMATDPDEGDEVMYSLDGEDAASFAIDAMTGQLMTMSMLDHETKDEYTVMVIATDTGGLTDSITVTITVDDVNDAPMFADEPVERSVDENTAADMVIGDVLMATDQDEGDAVTYSLGGTDMASFAIDSATGQLKTMAPLDFETKTDYEVTVIATDTDGLMDEITVTINVDDVSVEDGDTEVTNSAPVFDDGPSTTREIAENTEADESIGDPVAATDDDTLAYTLSGTDAASFDIDDTTGQLMTMAMLDHETKASYMVMVTADDGNGGTDTIDVTITVNDVNEAPMFADETAERSVAGNTAAGEAIGSPVAATDADSGDDLTYSLGGTDAGSFDIDAMTGQLKTLAMLDHETKASYTVMVIATDTDGLMDEITVTITVTEDTTANTPPTFDAGSSVSYSIVEGGSGRTVGSPTATDLDGDSLTYAISSGNIAGLFAIDNNGRLTTARAVTPDSHTLTVTVSDSKNAAGTADPAVDDAITVSITVRARPTGGQQTGGTVIVTPPPATPGTGTTNNAPTFADGASTSREVAENTPAGQNIGSPVSATDPNGDTLTYALGGTDAASFDIDSTNGQLKTRAALDYETKSSYSVAVDAKDASITTSITVTINVTDVAVEDTPVTDNVAPEFASQTAARSIAENTAAGAAIGTPVTATDSNTGDVLTYTLGGTDAASFGINAATGQLMTQAMLDHETKASYTVMVTATDRAGLTDSITVTITVTNVNEAPMFADETATRMVDENTAADMMIGDAFMATDPDDGDEVMYSLGGDDMGSFAIDAATGQLMTMAMLDHETKDSYMVMVTATDEAGLTGSIMVTISVTDVNDAPMFASATAERMVEENTAAGMAIGDPLTAMDDDGDDVTYSLGGDDMGSFAIDAATGQLMTMAELDHETKASHTVMVTASDGTDMSSITVTIMVTDVPEFMLTVPAGQSLIHIPLKMAGLAKISDLYDKLGGAANVNLLITYDPMGKRWLSYIGDRNKGQTPDKDLTDDMGILAVMKEEVTVQLSGDPLGTDGTASIMLQAGTNLVGVPLKDSRITNVGDLLELEGIKDNVSYIIVEDGGEYRTVTRAGDPGDVAVTGGQSFVLQATEAATVMITGDGWASSAATAAPSWISRMGIQKDGVTAALAVTGSIVDGVKGLTDFHITVKNLSTGKVDTVATSDDGVGYQLTFVDIETGRAAQIGDHLEISARSADPLVGVEPLRYMVTVEDVKRGHIQLDTLVTYEIPAKTELLRNYPNPFNPETWIPYRLAKDATVTLEIYDTTGGIVRNIHIGHQLAAIYESRSKAIYWDGRNNLGERVASGIYFYHLSAGDYSAARKMVILK